MARKRCLYLWHRISNKVWRLASNPCNKTHTTGINAICYVHTLKIHVTSFILSTYWYSTLYLPFWLKRRLQGHGGSETGSRCPSKDLWLRVKWGNQAKGECCRSFYGSLLTLTETLAGIKKKREEKERILVYISNPFVTMSSHVLNFFLCPNLYYTIRQKLFCGKQPWLPHTDLRTSNSIAFLLDLICMSLLCCTCWYAAKWNSSEMPCRYGELYTQSRLYEDSH
jgi:hypothetical protein